MVELLYQSVCGIFFLLILNRPPTGFRKVHFLILSLNCHHFWRLSLMTFAQIMYGICDCAKVRMITGFYCSE